VKKNITDLVRMGYVDKDKGRGKGNYILNLETFENEKLYFDYALKYRWQEPSE
jgi:hypothetical protein